MSLECLFSTVKFLDTNTGIETVDLAPNMPFFDEISEFLGLSGNRDLGKCSRFFNRNYEKLCNGKFKSLNRTIFQFHGKVRLKNVSSSSKLEILFKAIEKLPPDDHTFIRKHSLRQIKFDHIASLAPYLFLFDLGQARHRKDEATRESFLVINPDTNELISIEIPPDIDENFTITGYGSFLYRVLCKRMLADNQMGRITNYAADPINDPITEDLVRKSRS